MKIKALSRTWKLLARLRDADATFESPLSLQYNFGLQRLSLTQQRMSYKLLQNSLFKERRLSSPFYSHTLPIRVCAAQRGRDFEAPDLEQGIHFRGVF